MLIRFDENDFLVGICILCGLLIFLQWRKRSLSYLVFFSIFWVYLLAVIAVVIFPVAINMDYVNEAFTPSINLIPFYFSSCSILKFCVIEIVGNIILTIPFGFGINFLTKIKPSRFLWLSLAVGFTFEFSQLVISIVFRSGFRTVDINDVMLNALGVLFGYALFRAFAWAYLKFAEHFEIKHKWLLADVYTIAFQTQTIDKSKKV
jgi:glycopeptide antibiotics resistance protein